MHLNGVKGGEWSGRPPGSFAPGGWDHEGASFSLLPGASRGALLARGDWKGLEMASGPPLRPGCVFGPGRGAWMPVRLVPLGGGSAAGRLAQIVHFQWGRILVDVGQGRGGECQFLSVLFLLAVEKFLVRDRTWWVSWDLVDCFRARLAGWLEEHQDWRPNPGTGAPSLKELFLWQRARGDGDTGGGWGAYLLSVRRGGWGDAFTLLAATAVLGRVIVPAALSVGAGGVSSEPIVPPEACKSGTLDERPLCVGAVTDRHYFAVVERGLI